MDKFYETKHDERNGQTDLQVRTGPLYKRKALAVGVPPA